MDRLFKLLSPTVFELLKCTRKESITELRLRINRPVTYCEGGVFKQLIYLNKPYICERADLDYVVGAASNQALYSVSDAVSRGFLFYKGGIRIGICGEGVTDRDKLSAYKNITSLTIRLPHEVKGCADELIKRIYDKERRNVLIVAPPAAGKTTLLREIARRRSECGINVLIIDERYELAASFDGKPSLDVGINTDVLSGVPKISAYQNVIRSMNPDLIITDEVYTAEEVESVVSAVRAGVGVAASVHANGIEALERSHFKPLLEVCSAVAVLSKQPRVGTVKELRLA